MKEVIHPFDLHRIFVGDAPVLFLVEIVFRTIIMYAYTFFLLRVLGKRGMGQLSTLEFAIIIGFGSAVGDPMMQVDVPITYGVIAITVITFLQIGLEKLINNNSKIEILMEGEPNLVVYNGAMNIENMVKDNLSKEDLFRLLRIKDVTHLGQIDKAFFETTGQISVMLFPTEKVKHGLSILPKNIIKSEDLLLAYGIANHDSTYACTNCGYSLKLLKKEIVQNCPVCNEGKWMEAMV